MFHSEQAPGHRLDEIFLRLKSKAKKIIRTITGNLPLIVPEAVASAIRSLTRYGLCTQDGTPAPDAPVDIMCNNGALKWDSVNQRVYADGTPEVLTVRPGEHLVLHSSDFEQEKGSANSVWTTNFIEVESGGSYVFSFDLVSTLSSVSYDSSVKRYDADGNYLGYTDIATSNGCRSGYFTAPSDTAKVRIQIHGSSTSNLISPSDLVSARFDTQSTAYAPTGKNLFNRLNCTYGYFLSGVGDAREGKASCYSNAIPVTPGNKYTLSGISEQVGSNNKRVCFYRENNAFISGSARTQSVSNADAPYSLTVTAPNNAAYCKISINTADINVMFEAGETQTAYEPYIDASWQTASVPMLLSVGDVKDEVELIAGTYTHRCAACEYDGTQDVGDVYMSTTGGKDAGAIIVYPLATPTTEQVTPQELTLTEGTNIIDATANIEPLTAKCKYQAVSALDILSALLGTRSGTEDMSIKDAKDVVNVILGDDNK